MMLLIFYLAIAFVLLYSVILHELAHAKVAEMMGDPTPRLCGRLTLNPLPHLDFLGTLLPVLLLLSGFPLVFGWAKPVPINPCHFHDQRRGILFVSAAGVVANLFLAWFLATLCKFIPDPVLTFGVRINIVLAVFNLIPVPPLDGGRIFSELLPYPFAQHLRRLEPFGFFILIFLLMFPPTEMLLWGIINALYQVLMARLF